MEKNPIHAFIERLPFFQEFSDDEKAKLVNTFGIFKKYVKTYIDLDGIEELDPKIKISKIL